MRQIMLLLTTQILCNTATEGDTIEIAMKKVIENKEPIENTSPLIYTERQKGIEPQYNIRTDRFDIAIEAMSKIDSANKARREEALKNKDSKKAENGDKVDKSDSPVETKTDTITTPPANTSD